MIFDTDEFLVPIAKENIPELLKSYEKDKRIGGICFIWSFFGTSNVYRIPEGQLLIETLIMHSGPANGGDINAIWQNGSYKSIVRPKYVSSVPSPHFCNYKGKRKHLLENYEIAHINHYWTRDQFFMETHKIPRRELWGQSAESVREWEAQMNQRCDDNPILRFVSLLRENMNMTK